MSKKRPHRASRSRKKPGGSSSSPTSPSHGKLRPGDISALSFDELSKVVSQEAKRRMKASSLLEAMLNFYGAHHALRPWLEPHLPNVVSGFEVRVHVEMEITEKKTEHELSLRNGIAYWDSTRVSFSRTQVQILERCCSGRADAGMMSPACWGPKRTLNQLKVEASRMRKRIKSVAGDLPVIDFMIHIRQKELWIVRKTSLAYAILEGLFNPDQTVTKL